MTYLRCFLTGDPLGSIICLYSSNVNYEVEVQRLKEHFERLYTVVTSVEWTREKFSDPIDRNVDAMTAETNLARLSFWQNKCCSLMKARSFRSGLEQITAGILPKKAGGVSDTAPYKTKCNGHGPRSEEDCSSEWMKGAWFSLVQKARCDGSSMKARSGKKGKQSRRKANRDDCRGKCTGRPGLSSLSDECENSAIAKGKPF
ncbi:hypothetical protein T03_11449 [Trichinella britovi]|uniref:Uncharacterized protein n=1 Tax=Trichinella britovi TaxID=45882 RepID=A0A0V1CW45_TRIBR|nr:hypothetical protein T03_11449 [Trichinella britovi]